jgi:hypothetical protein
MEPKEGKEKGKKNTRGKTEGRIGAYRKVSAEVAVPVLVLFMPI